MPSIYVLKSISRVMLNCLYRMQLEYPVCKLLGGLPLEPLLVHIWLNDFEYVEKISNVYKRALLRNGIEPDGKNIIEIGAGNSLGTGYFFLEKCASFTAIDMERTPTMSRRAFLKEISIIDRIQKKYGIDLKDYISINKGDSSIDYSNGARFLRMDITDSERVKAAFSGKQADILLSMAVLEHIDRWKIRDAIENMVGLLRPGGYMVHMIDFRDHFNLDYPFNFYKYSESQWNRLARGSVFYTNRIRARDYEEMFYNAGLKVLERRQGKAILNLEKEQISKEFRGRSDLDVVSMSFVLRKE